MSNAIEVTVNPTPTGSIGGTTIICQGDNTNLTFTLTGVGPFNVTYNDGGAPITLNGISDGHTVNVSRRRGARVGAH